MGDQVQGSVTAGGSLGHGAGGGRASPSSVRSFICPSAIRLLADTLGLPHEGESILGPEVPVLVAGHTGVKPLWLQTRGPAQPCPGPPWLSLWMLRAVPFSEGRPARSCRRGQGWPLLAWSALRPHSHAAHTVSSSAPASHAGPASRRSPWPPRLASGTRPPLGTVRAKHSPAQDSCSCRAEIFGWELDSNKCASQGAGSGHEGGAAG